MSTRHVFGDAVRLPVQASQRRIVAVVAAVLTLMGLLTAIAAPASAAPVAVGVNNPPAGTHNIIVFPQRDFISASGYAPGDVVNVYVIEPDGTVIGTDEANPPVADDTGLIEVNHPGGFCWFTQTPDIRPGDIVQIDIVGGPNAGQSDATTVRNITAKRPVSPAPGVVEVHGNATDSYTAAPGNPLPVAELEQRIVAPGNLFAANGRRTLRANSAGAVDGTLAYDPIGPGNPNGTRWTATYNGLSNEDVTLALGAESRGMWLGPTLTETSVYEIGALTFGGPAAPCTAPLQVRPPPAGSELIPPTDPTNLVGTFDGVNNVSLTWDASTDNVGVTAYGIYRDGQAVFTVSNPDGSAPAPTSYVERNLPPGTYSFTVRALDEVGNISGESNPAGPFTAVQRVDVNTFPVNDPPTLPINIIVFPSRDFISPSGYQDSDVVSVQLLRKNSAGQLTVVSSADGIVPIDGFAEVNHPGGACWAGLTPDIRVGDVVRTIAYNPSEVTPPNPDGIRSIDQTTVSGVTAFQPVVVANDDPQTQEQEGLVQIHGTALGADGKRLPLDQIEQRMIATHGVGLWDFNGRRALRAAANSDGTLTYDTASNPMGIKWTATYSGLDQADVDRMADADTRAHWLGRDPLLLNEATIFENAPGANPPGPAGPGCTRPLEAIDTTVPSVPGNFAATQTGPNQVTLSWTASTDNWSVAGYRIYHDGVAVANTPGTSYLANDVPFGPHTWAVRAYDTASPLGAGTDPVTRIASGLGNLYGNLSDSTNVVTLVQADVLAPSVPADLTVTSGVGQATLTWSASTDDVGVTEYGVYRGGTLVATVTSGTTYIDTGLAIGAYSYTVDAADAAGNRSAQSAPVSTNVTAVPDVVAPSVPSNVLAATSPDIHGRDIVVSWTASTDNVGVTGYRVYRDGTRIATVNGVTFAYTDANRPTGTFSYTVDAVDSAGNASAQSAPPVSAVVANDPPVAPHSLIAFPARDFISATGYTPGATYAFSLIRAGRTFLSAPFQADATGLIEVNHPGGTCWTVNTPDMRAGDVIRITDANGVADQTTVQNVTADRPIATGPSTVVVHGTAKDALGAPIPVAQLESRLIVGTATSFDVNGRRLLRASSAGGDGTLTYDGPGSTKWTATYTGLSANDVFRAVGGTSPSGSVFPGAESRAHWLGRDPLALTEATIFENGPGVVGGPSAPCTAVAETPVPAASLNLAPVTFLATAFKPAPQTSGPVAISFSNGGAAPMTLTNIYIAGANPGDFALVNVGADTCPTVLPATLAAGATCRVGVSFRPTALGLRQANVSFSDDAANTTDQTVPVSGVGVDNTDPIVGITPAAGAGAFGTVNATITTPALGTRTITVTNTSTDPTGRSLTVSAIGISGTNAADFTVSGTTCLNNALAPANPPTPAGSCTITVQFRPGARAARTATLTLTHNPAQKPSPTTSTTIPLTGTGGNGAAIAFGSNPVNFGTVTRNTTKDQTISVRNGGNQAATNLVVAVTGNGYTFRSTTCTATLAVNASCSVVVRFTAPNTVNTFTGTLSVASTNGIPATASTTLTATTK
jgi:hypothetical protein